jgi:predicted TPR repeat methyltransferase
MEFHQKGEIDRAEAAYRAILRSSPLDVNALHYLGVLCHQQGHSDQAIDLIGRAVALAPRYVDAWSNLGNVYKEAGCGEDAEAAYRRALALKPEHSAAWNNLGVILRARGAVADALRAFATAAGCSPDFADAYFNLGNALRDAGRLDDAVAAYRHTVTLDRRHTTAHHRLGYTLHMKGEHEAAAEVFRSWLAVEPDNPVPAHMLAASSGSDVPERASDSYVRQIFDGFAATFDDILLHRLHYHAPQRLMDVLALLLAAPTATLDVLDAGCGTGLCGPLLRPYARTLHGVDLSSGMLRRAHTRGTYDQLTEDEITRFLARHPNAFDVVASADTLCYFGDLTGVLCAARESLRPGGWLAFTLERGHEDETYRLQPHGRYRHGCAYVQNILSSARFDSIDAQPAVLRRELGADVQGFVLRARAR